MICQKRDPSHVAPALVRPSLASTSVYLWPWHLPTAAKPDLEENCMCHYFQPWWHGGTWDDWQEGCWMPLPRWRKKHARIPEGRSSQASEVMAKRASAVAVGGWGVSTRVQNSDNSEGRRDSFGAPESCSLGTRVFITSFPIVWQLLSIIYLPVLESTGR